MDLVPYCKEVLDKQDVIIEQAKKDIKVLEEIIEKELMEKELR